MKFRVVLIHILISVLFIFSGCNSNNSKPKEIQKTDTEKQKSYLLNRIEKNFDNSDAHFELGKIYQSQGLWAQAEQEFKTTLNFDPVNRKAQAARVKTLIQAGDKQKADLLINEYIERSSSSAVASLELALGFQNNGLDDYALTCYKNALRLKPNSATINRQIGYYYYSKQDLDRAKDYLTTSFNLNRNQPEVAGLLGQLGVTVKRQVKSTKSTRKVDKIMEEYDQELAK